jgi:hypothetical protein
VLEQKNKSAFGQEIVMNDNALRTQFLHAPTPIVPTAKEAYEIATQLGLTDYTARNAYVKRSASARHNARVAATKKVVLDATEFLVTAEGRPELAARAILQLDLAGIGGQSCLGGDSCKTDRLVPSLGKGRWNASDGPAWRAAAQDALADLGGPVDIIFVFAYGGNDAYATDPVSHHATRFPCDRPWLLAEALRQLTRALVNIETRMENAKGRGNLDMTEVARNSEEDAERANALGEVVRWYEAREAEHDPAVTAAQNGPS